VVRGCAAHVARFCDRTSVDVRLYPRKRTLIAGLGMSAKCHERTIKVRVKRSGERVRCGRPPRERPHIQGLLSYCPACALTACSTCLFTARPVVVSGPGTFPWPFLFVESPSFILRFAGIRDRVRHRISGVSHLSPRDLWVLHGIMRGRQGQATPSPGPFFQGPRPQPERGIKRSNLTLILYLNE
jgi:hypothetical protein